MFLILLLVLIFVIPMVAWVTESYKPFLLFILAPFLIYFHITGIEFKTWHGNHTGIITAIDTSGIFVKSTNVFFKTDVNSSQEDVYCLKDESLLPGLQALQEKKQVVTISYDEYLSTGIECSVSAPHIITSIK